MGILKSDLFCSVASVQSSLAYTLTGTVQQEYVNLPWSGYHWIGLDKDFKYYMFLRSALGSLNGLRLRRG